MNTQTLVHNTNVVADAVRNQFKTRAMTNLVTRINGSVVCEKAAASKPVLALLSPIKFITVEGDDFAFDGSNQVIARQLGEGFAMTHESWQVEYQWDVEDGEPEIEIPSSTAVGSEMRRVYILANSDGKRVAACLARNVKGNPVAEVYTWSDDENRWMYHAVTHKVRREAYAASNSGSRQYTVCWTKFHALARLLATGEMRILSTPNTATEFWAAYHAESHTNYVAEQMELALA